MVSQEVAGLAVSITAGAIKLGRRLDQIMAEEAALRSNTALPFPTVSAVATIPQMKARLRAMLTETEGEVPDPLGADRDRLRGLLADRTPRHELDRELRAMGINEFQLESFDPNHEFRTRLIARDAAWNLSLSDDDIHRLTYFVAAGTDHRENSLAFRIGATIVDSLAEFSSEHARLIVSNDSTRQLLEAIVRRFAKPDLASMPGWGSVLRHAVRATVNGLLDERTLLSEDREWLEIVLAGIARGRDLASNQDDFIIGLLRGQGLQHLIQGVLTEGSARLSRHDAPRAQLVLAEVIREAAARAGGASGFDTFFFEQWHALAAAGLRGLSTHGRRLLEGETPLIQTTLVAVVDALAAEMADRPPTGQTLVATVDAVIAVVADDPDLLGDAIDQPWLVQFIGSVADTMREEGLLDAFGAPAMERYVRHALRIMSDHPEILVGDSDVLQRVISGILGGIAEVDMMSLEALGNAAVAGALEAIADHADLIDGDYASVLGDLAGRLSELARDKRLTRMHAAQIIEVAAEVLATNTTLFVDAHRGLSELIIDAVVDAAEESDSDLLVGQALIASIERVLMVMSIRGQRVASSNPLEQIGTRLREVLTIALVSARDELGMRLDRRTIPSILSEVVDAWARDEMPAPPSTEFDSWFRNLAEEVARRAAA